MRQSFAGLVAREASTIRWKLPFFQPLFCCATFGRQARSVKVFYVKRFQLTSYPRFLYSRFFFVYVHCGSFHEFNFGSSSSRRCVIKSGTKPGFRESGKNFYVPVKRKRAKNEQRINVWQFCKSQRLITRAASCGARVVVVVVWMLEGAAINFNCPVSGVECLKRCVRV